MRRIIIIAAIGLASSLGVGVAYGQQNVLNCDDVYPVVNFPVSPDDPHNFDGNDNDGIGCEDPTKAPGEYPAKARPTPSSTPTEKSSPKPETTKKADVPKSIPAGL
jgi:hypothetical protein